jgi:hypothetical protein
MSTDAKWKPPRNEYEEEKKRLKALPKIKDKKPRKKKDDTHSKTKQTEATS